MESYLLAKHKSSKHRHIGTSILNITPVNNLLITQHTRTNTPLHSTSVLQMLSLRKGAPQGEIDSTSALFTFSGGGGLVINSYDTHSVSVKQRQWCVDRLQLVFYLECIGEKTSISVAE